MVSRSISQVACSLIPFNSLFFLKICDPLLWLSRRRLPSPCLPLSVPLATAPPGLYLSSPPPPHLPAHHRLRRCYLPPVDSYNVALIFSTNPSLVYGTPPRMGPARKDPATGATSRKDPDMVGRHRGRGAVTKVDEGCYFKFKSSQLFKFD